MVNGVNNVGFGNSYKVSQQTYNDLEQAVGFSLGLSKVDDGGPFAGMGLMLGIGGAMEAFKGGQWAYKNRKDLSGGWQKGVDTYKTDLAFKKDLFGNYGWKKSDSYKTLWNNYRAKTVLDNIPDAEKITKLEEAAKASENLQKTEKINEAIKNYKAAKNAAEFAKTTSLNQARAMKVANARLAIANDLVHGEIKPTGIGKIGAFFGKITGMSKLNGGLKALATKSPITASILKHGKGNGLFLAIGGIVELFTQVIPSFTQLGAGKGSKQLVKSTVKTGASVGGWVGGAAIGAAIGSIIPGAGTIIGGAIGSLCGLVGGFVGSWAATKAAEKVVGKNELDIAKEEQAKKVAADLSKDPAAMRKYIDESMQKLKEEGQDTPEAQAALGSLTRLAANLPKETESTEANETQTTTTDAANTTKQTQTTPNFTANPFSANSQYAAQLYGNNNIFGQQQADYKDQDFMSMNLKAPVIKA